MPITASCWVGVVDTAGAAMSEAYEWLRGTPTSATSENEYERRTRFSIAIRAALTIARAQNCERNAPRIC